MTKSTPELRARWIGWLLVAAAFVPGCANQTPASDQGEIELAVDDTAEALTQADFDCERTKRECLIVADCDATARDACESAFHACKEPAHAERERVRELCRAEREACDAAATDDAGHHACHVAEHRCKLPVDPPEAVCHIDALECRWAARNDAPAPTPPMENAAEQSCREQERACREAMRLDPALLPKPPECAPPAVPCTCEDPLRAERKRVREQCRAQRETCEAAATDEAGRHACHIGEHRCTLPVDPPEAICRIDAEECLWAAHPTRLDHDMPAPAPDPVTPPEPMVPPDPKVMPAGPSAAEQACHEAKHACVEANRVPPEDLPKPPRCPPPTPAQCTPEEPPSQTP